jgi:hypothetical protein
LIAVSDSGNINKYDTSTNSFIEFSTLQSLLDIRATGNYLIVTTAASVYVYGEQLSLVRQINNVQVTGYSPVFTCATSINDVLYIGTKENGLLTTTIVIASAENITPMGPCEIIFFFRLPQIPCGQFMGTMMRPIIRTA